jgi:hypothetical protein
MKQAESGAAMNANTRQRIGKSSRSGALAAVSAVSLGGLLALVVSAPLPADAARVVRGGTRTSVNRNVNANRNVNVNRDIDVDVDHDYGYHGGYHPVARVAATTAAVAVTAAVVGSVVHSLPPSCSATVVGNVTYQQCGSSWYQPQYSGSQITYVVVNPPY